MAGNQNHLIAGLGVLPPTSGASSSTISTRSTLSHASNQSNTTNNTNHVTTASMLGQGTNQNGQSIAGAPTGLGQSNMSQLLNPGIFNGQLGQQLNSGQAGAINAASLAQFSNGTNGASLLNGSAPNAAVAAAAAAAAAQQNSASSFGGLPNTQNNPNQMFGTSAQVSNIGINGMCCCLLYYKFF